MSFVVQAVISLKLSVFGNFFILHIETADPNITTAVSGPSTMELLS